MPIQDWNNFQEKFQNAPDLDDSDKAALLLIVKTTHNRGWDWYQTGAGGEFARAGIKNAAETRVFLTLKPHERTTIAAWNYHGNRPRHGIPPGRQSWSLADLANELSKPASFYLTFPGATRSPEGKFPKNYP